ncbi:hypothetical protein [Salipiger marinus]|uniref:Uncharacterized protein n=1 Tax=Salipiger marinus TaxID=555512 RepID=A0A1G8VEB4_9RHOB|nr:hypothetical protein [Salipiger marinus]SDJ63470.1 hypothetical protein SAMN04487993_10861 [Salipiger marinus]
MMTAAFTYQLGPSARRTLPAGWSGMVPAAIATRLEAEKAGARVTLEEEGDAVTTKPLKPAATSAVDAKPSASAAPADSATRDQVRASQSPAIAAATSAAAPAAAEPGSPAAPAAPEAGGASDPTSGGTADPSDSTGA